MSSVPALRVVADARLRTPPTARLVVTARQAPTWLVTRPGHPPAVRAAFQEAGVEILTVPAADPGGLDLPAVLRTLAQRGVTRVLAEGGAAIAAGLLRADLVDRVAWFHAPAVMGGDGRAAADALPVTRLAGMPRFHRIASRPLGADWLTELERSSSSSGAN
jgi:diaminohydroxyphosphoribosylaminopyrimidine deaminase/5-amino-6-(5-phosphoribosylamino)uracil reductase